MLPIAITYWPFLETVLNNNRHKIFYNELKQYNDNDLYRMKSNMISSFHAISIIVFGLTYLATQYNNLFYFIFFFSIVYFIYDSYSIWFNKNEEQYKYLFHHGATIYFLQCLINYEGITKKYMVFGYILLEISNLPEYYIYSYLKSSVIKDEIYYDKLLKLKMGQIILYVIMRLFGFGYLFIMIYKNLYHQPILLFCIIALYIMGLYWSYRLSQGYLKTRNEYIKFKINHKNNCLF